MKTACRMALLSQKYRPHAKTERITFLILNTAQEETLQLIQLAKDLNYSKGLFLSFFPISFSKNLQSCK